MGARPDVLELAILGLLKEQPLHGYELKKRLGETLGSLWGISYGSLYPALRRLEHDGSIEIVEPESVSVPMPATGSLDGDLAAARQRRPAKATRRTKKAPATILPISLSVSRPLLRRSTISPLENAAA